jgi:hypothetical protein
VSPADARGSLVRIRDWTEGVQLKREANMRIFTVNFQREARG